MGSDYALRPFMRADLPMMALWLATPAARGWLGEADEQMALVSEDMDEPLMDQVIATVDGQPFGYLQSYPAHAWLLGAPHLADFLAGSMAVDCLVGTSEMIGKGHGAAMLRLYALQLSAQGAPEVLIDPDPDNERAVRACRRAGFRDVALRPDGLAK